MSFEHLGVVKNGVEYTESESVKGWAGAKENYTLTNYTLTEEHGKTKLVVDMESTDEFKDYFIKTFPVALEKVKELTAKKLNIFINTKTKSNAKDNSISLV